MEGKQPNSNHNEQTTADGFILNASGMAVAVVWKGQRYDLTDFNSDDSDEIEAYLLEQRKSPLAAIKAQFEEAQDNPKLQEMMVDRAYRDMRKQQTVDTISNDELRDYLDTRDGVIRSLWLMMRRQAPAVTLEDARAMFRETSLAEAIKRRDQASASIIQAAAQAKAQTKKK